MPRLASKQILKVHVPHFYNMYATIHYLISSYNYKSKLLHERPMLFTYRITYKLAINNAILIIIHVHMETRASLNCIIKTLHFIFFILNKKSLKIEQKLYHVPKHYSSVSKGKMTEFKSHKKLEVREIKKKHNTEANSNTMSFSFTTRSN